MDVWHFSKRTMCTLTKPSESKTSFLILSYLYHKHTTQPPNLLQYLFFPLSTFTHTCTCTNAMACMWSDDNLQDLFLFSYHVGSRDWAQFIRLGGKCLYSQRHLACPGTISWGHKKITPRTHNELAFISCLDVPFLCF